MREEFESYAKKHLGFRKNQFSKYIDGSYKNEQLRVYSEIWEASAWHAFQEQQKKIDKALELGYEKRGNVHYLVDEHIDEIQGVLE